MKLHKLMGNAPEIINETIATGFQELDTITGGLHIGELCAIGGRPGMGKTAFAVSLLRNIGVIQKVPTAFLSLELEELDILKRLKASISGRWETASRKQEWLPPYKLVKEMEKLGFYIRHEQNEDREALEMVKAAPVWIEHNIGVCMDDIVSRMEHLHHDNHIQLFIIDSLPRIMYATKYTEQSKAIVKLRQTAVKLKVPIVFTTILSRSVLLRGGAHYPMISDINVCGKFELYSSMIIFVHRPEYYLFETFEDGFPAKDMADIIVEKNSHGGTGSVRMYFDNHAGFKEMDYKVHDDELIDILEPNSFDDDESFPF